MKSVIRIGNNEVLQFVTENLVITGVNGRNHGRTDGRTEPTKTIYPFGIINQIIYYWLPLSCESFKAI